MDRRDFLKGILYTGVAFSFGSAFAMETELKYKSFIKKPEVPLTGLSASLDHISKMLLTDMLPSDLIVIAGKPDVRDEMEYIADRMAKNIDLIESPISNINISYAWEHKDDRCYALKKAAIDSKTPFIYLNYLDYRTDVIEKKKLSLADLGELDKYADMVFILENKCERGKEKRKIGIACVKNRRGDTFFYGAC